MKRTLKPIRQAFALVSAAVAGTAGSLLLLYKSQANAIDRLAKNAAKLGDVTAAFQAVKAAANLAGVGEQVETAMQRLTRRMSEAANGTGEALKATAELGLDPVRIAGLRASEQLEVVLDALHAVPDAGDRVRLAFKFFDTEGVGLVNLTSDAIRDAADELDRWGASITEQQAAWVQTTNDQMQRLGTFVRAAGTQFSVNLAPYIGLATERVLQLAEATLDWRSISAEVVGVVRYLWLQTVRLADGFSLVFNGIDALVSRGLSMMLRQFAAAEQGLLRLADMIPGLDVDPTSGPMTSWLQSLRERASEASAEVDDLATRLQSVQLFGLDGSVYAGELDRGLRDFVQRSEQAHRQQIERQRAILNAANEPMFNPGEPLFDNDRIQDSTDAISDQMRRVQSEARSAQRTIVNGFLDVAKGTENAFENMAERILEQLARIALERTLFGIGNDQQTQFGGLLGNLFGAAVGAPAGAAAANDVITRGTAVPAPIAQTVIVQAPGATTGTAQQIRQTVRALEANTVQRVANDQRRRAG